MEKTDRKKAVDHAGLAGAQTEAVQRYGSAVKEHFVSYSGVDNETGKQLTKGLKQIQQSKRLPVSRLIQRWQLLFFGYLMYLPERSSVSPSNP